LAIRAKLAAADDNMASRCSYDKTLCAALAVSLAAACASCARSCGAVKDSPRAAPAAAAQSSTGVAPQPLPQPSAATPAPVPANGRLNLLLNITRDGASGQQTLWGTIPELGMRQALGHSAAPFVCGVSFRPGNTNLSPPPRSVASAVDCGDPEAISWIGINEETLRIGGTEVHVTPRAFIVHEKIEQPLPPERECKDGQKSPISVSIAREANRLYLLIPSLGIKRELAKFDQGEPAVCRTTVRGLARRMDFECGMSGFESLTVLLNVQRDVLFVENARKEGLDGLVVRTRFGIELPCNAELKFQGFDFRSPRYQPLPDHCQGRCWITREACERRCAERFSDEQGKLTDAGVDCSHACILIDEQCTKRCLATDNK